MDFLPKQITLKDGSVATLRKPEMADAEGMLNYIQTICAETEFMMRTKEEAESMTLEGERKWLASIADSEYTVVCEKDGEIVGNASLMFSRAFRKSHIATVGIGIKKKCWHLGIGTALMTELLAEAERRPNISHVELEYIEGNDRASALYQKFGFRPVAEHPNALRRSDGTLCSLFYMQKELRSK